MRLRATNVTRGAVLGESVREARTFGARLVGLLGHRLEPGEGLLLVPCRSIHTFFMRFPIDAVFLDEAHRVVKLVPHLRPWRTSGTCRAARSVLELPAGTLALSGTTEGDVLQFDAAFTAWYGRSASTGCS